MKQLISFVVAMLISFPVFATNALGTGEKCGSKQAYTIVDSRGDVKAKLAFEENWGSTCLEEYKLFWALIMDRAPDEQAKVQSVIPELQ